MILMRTSLLPGTVGVFLILACGIGIIRSHASTTVVYGRFNSRQILSFRLASWPTNQYSPASS